MHKPDELRSKPVYSVAPPLLLLFLTVIYFWRQLVLGQSLYWGDIGLYFLPMQRILGTQLHHGRIPLWNPYILCGAPYVGNPQTWPLYPSSLFLFPFSAPHAINWMVAAHVWLAGYGMYLLLRRTSALRVVPCVFASTIFMFGGQIVSKEQFPNMVQAMAYAPWILLALDRFLECRCWWTSAVLGAVVGLQVLAAHAQITMLSLYLGVAYGLFRLGGKAWAFYRRTDISAIDARRSTVREAGRLVGFLLFGGVIALGLSAGQTLAIIELFTHAWRQKLTFKIVNRFYLPPNQLLNFTLPTLHGHPYFGNFTARGNFWETCCYVGWAPVIMAFVAAWLAIVRRRKRSTAAEEPQCRTRDAVAKVRFWSTMFLVGVWMSTGGAGKIYRGAWFALPGFRNFHDPARCLLWATVALSILAAYGLHAVMRRLPRRSAQVAASIVVLLTFVDLCRFGATLYPLASPAQINATIPGGALSMVKADHGIQIRQARVLGPDSARVWERFTTHRSFRQSVPGYCALWRDTITPNLSMDAGLLDGFGYEPETRLDVQRVLGMIDAGYAPGASPRAKHTAALLSGIYGVRYVATLRVDPPDAESGHLSTVYSQPALPLLGHPDQLPSRIYLSRNLAWQPRARLTTDFTVVPTRWDAVRAYEAYVAKDDGVDVVHSTMVADQGGDTSLDVVRTASARSSRAMTVAPGAGSTVDVDDVSPDRVDVTATASRPCLLVLADTLHPGWSATVDGRREDILSADGFVRAIPLRDPGHHVVSFIYRPSTFFVGLYLSLLTCCFLAASLIGRYVCRKCGQELVSRASKKDA